MFCPRTKTRARLLCLSIIVCLLPLLLAAATYPGADEERRYFRDDDRGAIDIPQPKWPANFNFPVADITGPMPELGTFNDFEDPAWVDEIEAKNKLMENARYRLVFYLNAALKGNAVAAFELGDAKEAAKEFPEEFASLWEFRQWMDFTDALTSSGWWHLYKNTQVQRDWQKSSNEHYQFAAQMGHPVAMYAMAKNAADYFYPKKPNLPTLADFGHESARRGFSLAQGVLAHAYMSPKSPDGAEWVNHQENEAKNKLRSMVYAKTSAQQGDPRGMVYFGINHRGGSELDLNVYAMYCYAADIAIQERVYPNVLTMSLIEPEYPTQARCGGALFLEHLTEQEHEDAKLAARQWFDGVKANIEVRRQAKLAERAEVCRNKLAQIQALYTRLYEWAAKENVNLPPMVLVEKVSQQS